MVDYNPISVIFPVYEEVVKRLTLSMFGWYSFSGLGYMCIKPLRGEPHPLLKNFQSTDDETTVSWTKRLCSVATCCETITTSDQQLKF